MSHIFKNPEGLAGGADYTVTRVNGIVTQVATAAKTMVLARGNNNAITSITDGTYTWTYTRDGNNKISAKTITEN